MGKTLRVCLAMGGGVSLGSFSGAALTEALKLLILYGHDPKGQKYDKVVVDGMSGASAGAIALVIMLKSLIDYKAMMKELLKGYTEDKLIDEIAKSYFNSKQEAENHPNIKELKALQVAQKLQEELWVDKLNAKQLFGDKKIKNYKLNIHESFGLLDRQLLEELAKEYIIDPKFDSLDNIQVLDKVRVPFACSLTNLAPIEIRKDENGMTELEKNVIQSVGSHNHKELRIMDFVFDKSQLDKDTDDRWLQFGNEEKEEERKFKLNSREGWSIVCASALACGAFPIAFEPVVLKRYKEEYGENNSRYFGQWPKQFNDLNNEFNNLEESGRTSRFNENKNNVLDYSQFNFPYIDGGTFNNEPIREAFRIAAFQDFGNEHKSSDRLVMFVDPIVRTDRYQPFNLSSLASVSMDKKKAEVNSELDKLIGVTSSILNSLTNQGRIKEEDKIRDVSENLKLRKTIFNYLQNNKLLGSNLRVDILTTAYNKVESNLHDDMIPLGTRNVIRYFKNELIKTCNSKTEDDDQCLWIPSDKLNELILKINSGEINDSNFNTMGYKVLGIEREKDKNTFAAAVFKIIFDFSLNTDGKNEMAERVAILPLSDVLKVTKLPGEEVSAFGGFVSKKARQYAFNYAKLSALKSLAKKPDNISNDYGFRGTSNTYPFIISDALDLYETKLINSVKDIKFWDDINSYQNNIRNVLLKLSFKRLGVVTKNLTNRFNLFITAIGAAILSVFRFFSKVNWFVRTIAYLLNLFLGKKVQITHKYLTPVTISILSNQRFRRKIKLTTADNKIIRIKKVTHKLNGTNNYQYLFQLYQAMYTQEMDKKMKIEDSDSERYKIQKEMKTVYTNNINSAILSLQSKVELPTGVDRNLNSKKYNEYFESNYENIVNSINIGNIQLPLINKALLDKSNMLFHSFNKLKSHLSPMIEIDLNKTNPEWYFKENTKALSKQFLER